MKNLLTTILTLAMLLNPLSALASVEGQERGVMPIPTLTPTHQEVAPQEYFIFLIPYSQEKLVAPPYSYVKLRTWQAAALRDGGTTSTTAKVTTKS